MARLLDRLKQAPNSPDIYAGLVYACRFCGLLDASVGAHLQAHRFSSHVPTSVAQTHFVMGSYERCLETYHDDLGYVGAVALLSLGRDNEAAALVAERERWRQTPLGLSFLQGLRALIEGRRDDCVRIADAARLRFHPKGEELFYIGRHYARAGDADKAVQALAQAVETGYFNFPTLEQDPWLAALRGSREFDAVLQHAAARHHRAEAIFAKAGGRQFLN